MARGTGECGSGQGDGRGQGERGRPGVGRGRSGGRTGAARRTGAESAKGTGSGLPGGEAGAPRGTAGVFTTIEANFFLHIEAPVAEFWNISIVWGTLSDNRYTYRDVNN